MRYAVLMAMCLNLAACSPKTADPRDRTLTTFDAASPPPPVGSAAMTADVASDRVSPPPIAPSGIGVTAAPRCSAVRGFDPSAPLTSTADTAIASAQIMLAVLLGALALLGPPALVAILALLLWRRFVPRWAPKGGASDAHA